MSGNGGFYKIEKSALWTIVGVILLFSTAIAVTLIAPRHVDSTWTSPASLFQVLMYEVEDPNIYLSSSATKGKELQYVRHLKNGFTLLAFKESENLRFVFPDSLKEYVTPFDSSELVLTSRLLLLRTPIGEMAEKEKELLKELASKDKSEKFSYQVLELYDPKKQEAFSIDRSGASFPNWIDNSFKIIDQEFSAPYHKGYGVVYVQNPKEFLVVQAGKEEQKRWRYDPSGIPISTLEQLVAPPFEFYSRKQLITLGERIYASEGCWYCHTDQTRTLIQDTVLNGSDSFPAPPSSPNEYIYENISFLGTRRIGPDISRVGIKKPSRDWHKGHFFSPKTASPGSIMPAFQHFFDNDPRGVGKSAIGIPNYQFEAIYQYLMTKGTRITPPTQGWWNGKDPVNTMAIIEGRKAKND